MVENKDKNLRPIYWIITIISLICLIFSIVIYLEKTQYSVNHNNICSAITGTNGCEVVQTSSYGKTFGIDNPIYGIIGFFALGLFSTILIWKHNLWLKWLTVAGGIMSSIVAIIFIYLQAFVIHAYCLFCMIVDTLSLVLLGLVIYIIIRTFKHK